MGPFTIAPDPAAAWTFQAGREPGGDDHLLVLATRHAVSDGLVARDAAGTVVGAVTLTTHADRLAWVGGVSATPDARAHGVERALLDAVLAQVRDVPTVGVDATLAARPLFEAAGFRAHSTSTRWARVAGAPRAVTGGAHSVHPISLSEAMEIAAFDADRFGAKRARLLLAILHEAPWWAFMTRDRQAGDVTGYALGHVGGIGPLVADDAGAAAALLAACGLAGAPQSVLASDAHVPMQDVLAKAGYARGEAHRVRMIRGEDLPGRGETLRAYATWSLG